MDAYGSSIEHVDVAKVAIRVGAHFIVIVPAVWGRLVAPGLVAALGHHGVQLIQAGCERDDACCEDLCLHLCTDRKN